MKMLEAIEQARKQNEEEYDVYRRERKERAKKLLADILGEEPIEDLHITWPVGKDHGEFYVPRRKFWSDKPSKKLVKIEVSADWLGLVTSEGLTLTTAKSSHYRNVDTAKDFWLAVDDLRAA